MITRFTDAEGAVEEAVFRAAFERKAQAICADRIGFRVLPLSSSRGRASVIEIVRPYQRTIKKENA